MCLPDVASLSVTGFHARIYYVTISLSLSLSLSYYLSLCLSLSLSLDCVTISLSLEGGFSCPWVLTAREIGPNEVVSLLVERHLLSR